MPPPVREGLLLIAEIGERENEGEEGRRPGWREGEKLCCGMCGEGGRALAPTDAPPELGVLGLCVEEMRG